MRIKNENIVLLIFTIIEMKYIICVTSTFSIELYPQKEQCIYDFFPDKTLSKIHFSVILLFILKFILLI